MTSDILLAIISALVGGIITLFTSFILDHRKEKRQDRLESKKLQREAFQNRPEMQIIDFKDYIVRAGCGVKQKCDIELFVAHIDRVTIEGKKKNSIVHAHYNKDHLNPDEWCCVIYVLKNAGKTDISTLHMIWHFQKSFCIFPVDSAIHWAEGNLLNYEHCYDTKIRARESISLKICYHKDAVVPGLFSAPFSIGMIDDNGGCWTQPLFAPQKKVYDSRAISFKEYSEQKRTETAEECFKRPWLW